MRCVRSCVCVCLCVCVCVCVCVCGADAGIGAGIDSYYEYLLKAFVMLGDSTYLGVFNTHYAGIMRFLKRGPFLGLCLAIRARCRATQLGLG